MENLDLENNTNKISRKIPLAIILILLLAGIFLFVWYYFFYSQDSIAKYITEDVNFYSHWQVKQILQKNNAQIQTLIDENDKLKHILPDNYKEKFQNSSEYALINFENQWISVFKPKNFSAFTDDKFKHKDLVFENISDSQMFLRLLNNKNVLSDNDDFMQTNITNIWDRPEIIVYIKNPKAIIDEKYLNISKTIFENLFFQVYLSENEIFAKTKGSIQNDICINTIENTQYIDYLYYINNLSTKNTAFSNMDILANMDTCIDLLVFPEKKWVILFEKAQIDQFKYNISTYLANKYPIEKIRQLPDQSSATHIFADISEYSWEKEENIWSIGNKDEKYYLIEENSYFVISNNIKTLTSQKDNNSTNQLTKCDEYAISNSIIIQNPDSYLFNFIQISQDENNTFVCIH